MIFFKNNPSFNANIPGIADLDIGKDMYDERSTYM
jgi:hypothetical protein